MNLRPDLRELNALAPPLPGGQVSRILAAALQAADPEKLIRKSLHRRGDRLVFPDQTGISLTEIRKIYLVAVGKAAFPMVQGVSDLLSGVDFEGILVTKQPVENGASPHFPGLNIITAGHPRPDHNSLKAGRTVHHLLGEAGRNDLVLFLLSGGGSSLLSLPLDPLQLEDLVRVNKLLLESGAAVDEINTVRKHLSRVKGGQLARRAYPAQSVTLILSDVIGDPLHMIASGPTVPDPTTFQNALDIVRAYHMEDQFPEAALDVLRAGARGTLPETPKPDEAGFQENRTYLIGNNRTAALGALEQARQEGFQSAVLTTRLEGEARTAAAFCAAVLQEMAVSGDPLPRPACLIIGGETTVTIPDSAQAGLGGRNLEAALAAVPILSGLKRAALITLATDGEDGPTPAAGAVATGESQSRAQTLGLKPDRYLENHNAYPFFQELGDLIHTGSTRTNLNDLWFLFTFEEESS